MSLESLLLSEAARAALAAYAQVPPQGLLLVGPEGIGKVTVARAFASQITDHASNVSTLSPGDQPSISVDAVRDLYKTTRSKREGHQIVIIDHAEHMSLEAENAFLKLLEEPRSDLTFILTASHSDLLLPTILSRVQTLELHPLGDEVIRRFVLGKRPGISPQDLTQISFLAEGRPATATALLAEGVLEGRRTRMQRAKQLVTAAPYERLVKIPELATDRAACTMDLVAMMRIAETQIKSAASPAQIRHWALCADVLDRALYAITHNGSIRAQLLLLFSSY